MIRTLLIVAALVPVTATAATPKEIANQSEASVLVRDRMPEKSDTRSPLVRVFGASHSDNPSDRIAYERNPLTDAPSQAAQRIDVEG